MAKKLSFFPYMGGKHRILDTLLKNIPSHRIYVEVFGGSAKLLLNKAPSKLEIYNDYDKRLANLFYVTAFKFDEFCEKVNRLAYSREIYKQVANDFKRAEIEELGDVDLAVKTYFKLHATFSGQLNSYSFRSSTFTNSASREFFSNVDKLALIHERLKNVTIECKAYDKMIEKYTDREDAFIYLDPPYFNAEQYYDAKFKLKDHEKMLSMLRNSKAKWLLSGYSNELYDSELKDFYKLEIQSVKTSYGMTEATKHLSNERPRSTEILWANYEIKL